MALAVYQLNPEDVDKPALLWSHAIGFAAEAYAPFLARLTGRFRVFACDVRGHGRSEVPPEPYDRTLTMSVLTEDLGAVATAVREAAAGNRFVMATHSLAGAPALRAAWQLGWLPWDELVAFDPPVFPTPGHPLHDRALAYNAMLAEGARRRRARWDSPESFYASLEARPPFDGWDKAMLAAYVHGALKEEGGDWVLRCPPAVEAALYDTVQDATTLERLSAHRGSLSVVSADGAHPGAGWLCAMVPTIRDRIAAMRQRELPGKGHLMMFEDPELCAACLYGFASPA